MFFPLDNALRPLYVVVSMQHLDTRWRLITTGVLILQILVMVYVLELHSSALSALSERLARVETKIDLLRSP